MNETTLKLMVLGDIGVGKTSLISRYTLEQFSSEYRISTEPGFEVKDLYIQDKKINLQLWDIPGHEIFTSKTQLYYKYSHGALVLFDLSRRDTFIRAQAWIQDYLEKMELGEDGLVSPLLLVGNKADLSPTSNSSKVEEYKNFCSEKNILEYVEVSARDNSNIVSAIRVLAEHVLNTDANFA